MFLCAFHKQITAGVRGDLLKDKILSAGPEIESDTRMPLGLTPSDDSLGRGLVDEGYITDTDSRYELVFIRFR